MQLGNSLIHKILEKRVFMCWLRPSPTSVSAAQTVEKYNSKTMAHSRISIYTSTIQKSLVVVVVLKVWVDVRRDGRIVEIRVHSMSEA
jgi:hypothetical protein